MTSIVVLRCAELYKEISQEVGHTAEQCAKKWENVQAAMRVWHCCACSMCFSRHRSGCLSNSLFWVQRYQQKKRQSGQDGEELANIRDRASKRWRSFCARTDPRSIRAVCSIRYVRCCVHRFVSAWLSLLLGTAGSGDRGRWELSGEWRGRLFFGRSVSVKEEKKEKEEKEADNGSAMKDKEDKSKAKSKKIDPHAPASYPRVPGVSRKRAPGESAEGGKRKQRKSSIKDSTAARR